MQLRYFVPFKAQEGVDAQYVLKEKLLNIEGEAIDDSVNLNKWQVPAEDLDFFVSSLIGAQLRIDHAESAMAVIGKVPEGKREGNIVRFRAEIGDEAIIEKVLRGYLSHVSVQVDSDDIECSRCKRPTRKEGVLIHLCPGAWEIVHKPKVRELSIVASPAYKNTTFAPLGFAAAMNESQKNVGAEFERLAYPSEKKLAKYAEIRNEWRAEKSGLLNSNEDVGSRRESQGPENKTIGNQEEVKHLSEQQNAQQGASPHKAQVINLGEGESAPKQVTYEDLMNQVTSLQKQMGASDASDSEIETLNKKVAELEGELSKRAKKSELSRRIAELSKKLSSPGEAEEGDEDGDGNGGPKPMGPIDVVSEEASEKKTKKASGKGIVAVEEVDKNGLKGPDYDWFSKDLLKAASQLPGFK
jgi:hypothetical protein